MQTSDIVSKKIHRPSVNRFDVTQWYSFDYENKNKDDTIYTQHDAKKMTCQF